MNEYKDVYATPGAFSWTELMTSDPAAAAKFYGALLGWTFDDMPEAQMPGGYRVVKVGETAVGGVMKFQPGAPPMPPHWGSYVTVADLKATVDKVAGLGGKVLMPGMEIPKVGTMAVIQDPQGAVLNLIQYQMPDS
jgi:predicted enzyme related to lactoylglutathione lyase